MCRIHCRQNTKVYLRKEIVFYRHVVWPHGVAQSNQLTQRKECLSDQSFRANYFHV